jgi:hypothetical protein
LLAATSLVAVLGLAGCWDDNNSSADPVPPTASTEVPDSAGISTASIVSFILGLSGSDESSEPLTIKDTFAVPADESAEPTPLT